MVHQTDLTSLGIVVDRCEMPDHIRRMFVADRKDRHSKIVDHHNRRTTHCLHMWKTNGM